MGNQHFNFGSLFLIQKSSGEILNFLIEFGLNFGEHLFKKMGGRCMQRRRMLAHGYNAFTGVVPSDDQIDRYNRIQERINSFIDAGMPVSEALLNESHVFFTMITHPGWSG
jgi:hypothetical protein